MVTDLSNRRCIDIRTTKRADIAGPGEHLLNGGTNHGLNYASNGCRRLLSASLVTDPGTSLTQGALEVSSGATWGPMQPLRGSATRRLGHASLATTTVYVTIEKRQRMTAVESFWNR